MNASKILNRGHQNLLDALKDLAPEVCTQGIVTGSWTVKDVMDHLATYEELQLEAFRKFLATDATTPLHDQKVRASFLEFNETQWKLNKNQTWEEVLKRYMDVNAQIDQMVKKLSSEQMTKPDATLWYGDKSSFDDVIAYSYGHKKHHIAQIKLFRQRNNF